MEEINYTTG